MRKAEIARDILAYLISHPGAQDILDGIVEWWILEQRIKSQMAAVQEALADLVAEKLVLKRQGKDSRIHYRINARHLKKIREVLNQGGLRAKKGEGGGYAREDQLDPERPGGGGAEAIRFQHLGPRRLRQNPGGH